ncbi:MAG: hypothetical protein ACTHOC_06225 [Luteimonas sp.]
MPRTIATLMLPALLLATAAHAQDAAPAPPPANCPQLPADAGLAWEGRSSDAGDFCRALFPDGSEAFGLYITPEATFEPVRRNRAERGYTIDGHEVTWYRAQIASEPGVQARETTVELADGRHAHIWLQSPSQAQLDGTLKLVGGIHFTGAGIASTAD